MLRGNNLGLVVPQRVEYQGPWKHAFVTDAIIEHVAVSSKTVDFLFPLYLYVEPKKVPKADQEMLLPDDEEVRKTPNISPALTAALSVQYGEEPTPEDIFHYCYAVIFAPSYRKKFEAFLKMDFPQIPFTKDHSTFTKMVEYGKKLVELHLLESKDLNQPLVRYQGTGDNTIEKVDPKDAEKRVYINDSKYFEGIDPEVYDYDIGGYRVLESYLKERKKRGYLDSDLDEPKTFCRIATALAKTIEIQREIDAIYPEVEKSVIKPPRAKS